MFGYLWMCLRLSDIDPICAKSNGHSLVFISLHFLASSGPLTLASLSPRSQFSFVLRDRSISASTANPPYSVLSLCRPRTRPIHARPPLRSHPHVAFCLRWPPIMTEAPWKSPALVPKLPKRSRIQTKRERTLSKVTVSSI